MGAHHYLAYTMELKKPKEKAGGREGSDRQLNSVQKHVSELHTHGDTHTQTRGLRGSFTAAPCLQQ